MSALVLHHRYLRAFAVAHRAANQNAKYRAARKAQYWMDRHNILNHVDD